MDTKRTFTPEQQTLVDDAVKAMKWHDWTFKPYTYLTDPTPRVRPAENDRGVGAPHPAADMVVRAEVATSDAELSAGEHSDRGCGGTVAEAEPFAGVAVSSYRRKNLLQEIVKLVGERAAVDQP